MSNGTIVTDNSDSTNRLKSIFEQSLAVMCEGKDSVKTGSQTERVRQSSIPLHVDAVNLQKRALDNAAKALATLWKISESKRPKLQSRAMQCSRATS